MKWGQACVIALYPSISFLELNTKIPNNPVGKPAIPVKPLSQEKKHQLLTTFIISGLSRYSTRTLPDFS